MNGEFKAGHWTSPNSLEHYLQKWKIVEVYLSVVGRNVWML